MVIERMSGRMRPTILVAEPEPTNVLSTRKLVLETAKYNVLTAHSTLEAVQIFRSCSKLSAAVLVLDGVIDCRRLTDTIKAAKPRIPVIVLAPRLAQRCDNADHNLSSHEPEQLLVLLRKLLGDPRVLDSKVQRDVKRR